MTACWPPIRQAILGLLLTAAPVQAAGGNSGAACPPSAIAVPVGASLQAAVDAARPGAAFCLGAGEHRLQSAVPQDGQSFHGEAGAILSGARLVTEFWRDGRYWVTRGQRLPEGKRDDVPCLPGRDRCSRPESVFIDDAPLLHVGSLDQVVQGTFFLDDSSSLLYFVDQPLGRKVELGVTPFAFRGGARDVLIENLTIEKYAPPVQFAAVGFNQPSPGWTVRNNDIRLNYALGVNVGAKSRVLDNRIHRNGQMGAGCTGADVLFERNEIALNGTFSGVDLNWEGGGAKCALTERLSVRSNHLHGNAWFGFWTDIDNIDSLYEDNLVEDNAAGGIAHEISYAAVIRRNTFRGNGPAAPVWLWGAAVLVQNSRDVEVYGNTIDMTGGGNGISLVQQDRGAGSRGPYVTTNNHVHDNTLLSATPDHGASGAIADHDPEGMRSGNNRFDRNLYRVANPRDDHWAWVDGFRGWAEHRAASGQEASGAVEVIGSPPGSRPGGG